MWRAIGGVSQGTSHEKNGVPCQDRIYTLSFEGGIVVSLADGAGSAELSHYGAEAVTKLACRFFSDNFDRVFCEEDGIAVKKELLVAVLQALDEVCEKRKCERKVLASTLLAVAIKNDSFILAHLGDGVIGCLKGDELRVASTPENGEFVNESDFTTSPNAIASIQLKKGKLGDILGFILMSDGPEVSLYNKKDHSLAHGVKSLMLSCSLLSEKKATESIRDSLEQTIKKRTVDDCSIVILAEKDIIASRLLQEEDLKKKVYGIRANDKVSSQRRLMFFEELLDYISRPKNIEQISRHFHIGKRVAR